LHAMTGIDLGFSFNLEGKLAGSCSL
jgi:hypothetical protein